METSEMHINEIRTESTGDKLSKALQYFPHNVGDVGDERYRYHDSDHPTIIILHASVGSGHRSAARAILAAFEDLRDIGEIPSDVRFELVDCLYENEIQVDGNAASSAFIGPTRPLYDLVWRYLLTGRLLWGGGTIWSRTAMPSFTEHVREVKPIAVVCTHIMAANAAVGARMITKHYFPIISVPTDYETEGMWPHLYTDLFCVGTESMAETLRARKVEEQRILVTGIPTRLAFTNNAPREEVCKKYNLPLDKRLALVLAGAKVEKPYQRFRTTIDHTLPLLHRHPGTHFVIICGEDPHYRSHMSMAVTLFNLKNVTLLDYVDDIGDLMKASDVAICKAGGLTVTECLNAQLPMILVGKSYGQEKINVRMLTYTGCAYSVTTPVELASVLHNMEQYPRLAESMRFNESLLARPNAAYDIAIASWTLANSKPVDYPKRSKMRLFIHPYFGNGPIHVR